MFEPSKRVGHCSDLSFYLSLKVKTLVVYPFFGIDSEVYPSGTGQVDFSPQFFLPRRAFGWRPSGRLWRAGRRRATLGALTSTASEEELQLGKGQPFLENTLCSGSTNLHFFWHHFEKCMYFSHFCQWITHEWVRMTPSLACWLLIFDICRGCFACGKNITIWCIQAWRTNFDQLFFVDVSTPRTQHVQLG